MGASCGRCYDQVACRYGFETDTAKISVVSCYVCNYHEVEFECKKHPNADIELTVGVMKWGASGFCPECKSENTCKKCGHRKDLHNNGCIDCPCMELQK